MANKTEEYLVIEATEEGYHDVRKYSKGELETRIASIESEIYFVENLDEILGLDMDDWKNLSENDVRPESAMLILKNGKVVVPKVEITRKVTLP